MKNLAFVSLILVFTPLCKAEPYVYVDGSYNFKAENINECWNLGTSNPMLGVCQEHFQNLTKNKLDSSYNNLLSKLTRDKKELINAQTKWEEFSNLQCQFEAKASESYSKPYKVYGELFNICMDELRVNRSKYLDYIDTDCAGCVK
jgi:uncharacterized protein YecT (DUF1311 family)